MTHDPCHNPNSAAPAAPSTTPGVAPDPVDDLQFDRAEPAVPPSPAAVAGFQPPPPGVATACAVCRRPIADYYFEAGGKVLCPNCQQLIAASMAGGSGFARFVKALALGIVAGLVGAAVWYAVRRISNSDWGIIAILVGVLVGAAVRKGSSGRGGVGYQLLAVLLTYLTISLSLVPHLLSEHRDGDTPVLFVAAFVVVFALVAPVLLAFKNIILLVIFGIALWEAWKINKHRPIVFNGPYRVASPAGHLQAGAPAAAPPYGGTAYASPGAAGYPAASAAPPAYAPPSPAPGAWPPPPPGGA